MTGSAISQGGVPIRLTDERWAHIAGQHCELAELRAEVLETISSPERIVAGKEGERLAMRQLEPGKWLVTVYRESAEDGFVITAFLTRRAQSLGRRSQIWPR